MLINTKFNNTVHFFLILATTATEATSTWRSASTRNNLASASRASRYTACYANPILPSVSSHKNSHSHFGRNDGAHPKSISTSKSKRSHHPRSMIRFSHAALNKTKRKYREENDSSTSSESSFSDSDSPYFMSPKTDLVSQHQYQHDQDQDQSNHQTGLNKKSKLGTKHETYLESISILTEVGLDRLLTQSRHVDQAQFYLDTLSYKASMSYMPTWLRHDIPPTPNTIDEKMEKLRSCMKIHFSPSDINTIVNAVKIASKDSREKISGALDFLYILVNVMDMGKPALIAAAFHYCSCVAVHEASSSSSSSSSEEPHNSLFEDEYHKENIHHPDTQYLFPLTNSGIENFGEHTMKIAFDLARLKGIENVASTLTAHTNTHAYMHSDHNSSLEQQKAKGFRKKEHFENLHSLLLSANAGGDWRALAIRSGACLYRLQGLLNFRVRHLNQKCKFPTLEETRVAREALQIYAPLAHRLGMYRLKSELEGIAFRLLYRRQHTAVSQMLHHVHAQDHPKVNIFETNIMSIQENSSFNVDSIDNGMKSVLDDLTIQVKRLLHEDDTLMSQVSNLFITARVKEPLSLWKKMLKIRNNKLKKMTATEKQQNNKVSLTVLDVPDSSALRVILTAKKLTPEEDDELTQSRGRALCYYVHQLLTSNLTPEQDNDKFFKDYIKHPKENGYQSLQYSAKTRWHGKDWPFEVQIRTSDMHRVAEYGLAAHWEYKMKKKREELGQDSYLKCREELRLQHDGRKNGSFYFPSLSSMQQGSDLDLDSNNHNHNIIQTQTDEVSTADAERAERVRLRAQKLAPYIEALAKSRRDLARERVFVFLSCGNSSSYSEHGTIISLRAGSCILDALREGEKRGIDALWVTDVKFLRNGREAELTERLENGDLLTVSSNAYYGISQ